MVVDSLTLTDIGIVYGDIANCESDQDVFGKY